MTLRAPVPLAPAHALDDFDCGQPALNLWLARHARQAQASGSAKTYVVTDADRVVGYYSLTVGQIESDAAPERARRGMGRYPLPVVILARLAVATTHAGRGLGRGLLRDAVARTLALADQAGIRALVTHPIDAEAARFYERFGFIVAPAQGQPLQLLLLKDARRMAQEAAAPPPPTRPPRRAPRRP